MASLQKRMYESGMATIDAESGTMRTNGGSPLLGVWKAMGCCDGMCGSAMGMAVRGGFDVTVAWLCTTLTYGGQTVVEALEHRIGASSNGSAVDAARALSAPKEPVIAADFDTRPPGYADQESDSVVHPKPIPEVVETLKEILDQHKDDAGLQQVKHEIAFCIGTLEYVVARLSSAQQVESNWRSKHMDPNTGIGSFLNLHCGHNNAFSEDERKELQSLLQKAMSA
eukprot:CAMPEP_0198120966 /NCGR_PEP_ID=MMETSP1442-20131203/30847_1 /TAXON_ID= /ORGANISM="Craspedostauros australis, Strain CCMP3328" /LENGTH=225 /DNA_ID=CAMNT_0043779705 /DNA_START=221 /DNA_END=898 /DNA_ORIENTATION=-